MEVLGSGLIAVDHMFLSEKQRSTSTQPEYIGSAGGGSVGNTLAMLALLGHTCSIVGLVGNDEGARIVRSDLTRFGVNHSGLVQRGTPKDPRPTRQYSHLIRSNGTHTFLEHCLKCGKPLRRTFQMTERDVTPFHIKLARNSRILFLDRVNGATNRLVRAARSGGASIAFDLSFPRFGVSLDSVRYLLGSASFVKTQDSVLRRVLKVPETDALLTWKQLYPETRLLLVTRGARGIRGYWRGKDFLSFFNLSAVPCEHLRDSAGAGDVLLALAIHLFLGANAPKDENQVEARIQSCQALASLKCSLFGARSLQRALLNQRTTPQEIIEIAQQIVTKGRATNSFPPTIGLPPPLSNPFRLALWGGCPVCGQSLSARPDLKGKTRLTQRYRDALSVAHLRMSHSYEVGLAYASTVRERFPGSAIFVGSGGSLSAASFATTLLMKGLGRIAAPLPPFEIWNLHELDPLSLVCLLSHGGENKDILMAADRLAQIEHRRTLVVTSTPGTPLILRAKSQGWLNLLIEGQERGFVATSGLLSTIAALAGAFSTPKIESELAPYLRHESLIRTFNQAYRFATDASAAYSTELRSDHLVVLASGWGWPAAVDFESKLVEGGVCTVELTEMKNFTHGRYVNSFHHRERRHFVMFVSPDELELANYMRSKLARYFESILIVETPETGAVGSIDLMIRGLFLAGELAHRAGVDLANPRYPSEARGMYGWAPKAFLDSNPTLNQPPRGRASSASPEIVKPGKRQTLIAG